MKAKLVKESVHFERGLDPKKVLKLGKEGNPLKISSVDEETSDNGPITNPGDIDMVDGNTWGETLDVTDTHELFSNWAKLAHRYMGIWTEDAEWMHAFDLEGEFIEYQGETYHIPETEIFESVQFNRNQPVKKSLDIGLDKIVHEGDVFTARIYFRDNAIIDPETDKLFADTNLHTWIRVKSLGEEEAYDKWVGQKGDEVISYREIQIETLEGKFTGTALNSDWWYPFEWRLNLDRWPNKITYEEIKSIEVDVS